MDIMNILQPVVAIGGMGAVFGVGLGIASKVFAVPVDERVVAVKDCLPGANCGGCGLAGCDALAKAIVLGEAKASHCPVASNEQREGIAEIMGIVAEVSEKMVAIVRCNGSNTVAKQKYEYEGPLTCHDAQLIQGGPKGCKYGCLGYGSCETVCPFDAIHIVDGLAVVDPEKCTACSQCVASCPRSLIYIGEAKTSHQVQCLSHDKGKEVKANCSEGCIGCTLCVKQCEVGAIKVENNLATIDVKKCTGCGKCAEKCPTSAIKMR